MSRYGFAVSNYETISSVISGLSLVVSTVVLILLVQQLRLLSRQVADARHSIDHSIRQADVENVRQGKRVTMEFLAGTLSKLQELSLRIPPSGSKELPAYLERAMIRKSPEFLDVRDYLNFLEDVCVGVNMGVFDEEVVRRSLGGRLRRAWSAYEPWVAQERKIVSDNLFTEIEGYVLSQRSG